MKGMPNLAIALVAAAFFALGFFVADRMSGAASAPAAQSPDGGAAFSGTEGAILIHGARGPLVLILRGSKLYRVDPEAPAGANNKVWGTLDAF